MFEDNNISSRSNFTINNIGTAKTPKLKVTDPRVYPSKNVLKEEFRILSECYYNEAGEHFEKNSTNYKLLDLDGTEITIDQLIYKYFSNPEEFFTIAQQPSQSLIVSFMNNKQYSTFQVIENQRKNFLQNTSSCCNNVSTKIHNSHIEENTTGESNCRNDESSTVYPEKRQHDESRQLILPRNIHRIGHSDKWSCENCNIKDDKWFMLDHNCKGLKN